MHIYSKKHIYTVNAYIEPVSTQCYKDSHEVITISSP